MRYSNVEIDETPLSKLGFGAMGFAGWFGARDESEWIRALHYALDQGVTFVDTARAYGDSEAVVGRALRTWAGSSPIVATKVESLGTRRRWGMPIAVDEVFPKGQVRSSAERSLRELGTDCLDLLQLHLWWPTWGTDGYWADELRELRDDGLVRHIGASIPDHRSDMALPLVQSGLVETVQTIINIFDPLALDALVPACAERGIAVIARCILDEGGLTGTLNEDTMFAADDYRYGYFDDTVPRDVYLSKVEALRDYVPEHAGSLASLALKFVTQAEGVSTALTSMHDIEHATANIAAVDSPDLSADVFDILRTRHRFIKNFNNATHWE
jgi:methylglyoxal reductase